MNKKILLILVAIIGVSITINGYLFMMNMQLQNQFDESTIEKDALKAEIATVVEERDEALTELESNIGNINSLNAEIEAIEQEKENLKAEVNTLITERDTATQENSRLSIENNQLSTELNEKIAELSVLNVPKILAVDFRVQDNRISPPYTLYATGALVNSGAKTAYNVKLNMVAYDVIGNLVINTTVFETNGITPNQYTIVHAYINYDGQPIASWTVTPEWTETS